MYIYKNKKFLLLFILSVYIFNITVYFLDKKIDLRQSYQKESLPDKEVYKQAIRGFTLLEVMLSIAILAMVAGAVYGIMVASIYSGEQIKLELDRQSEAAALVELLRTNFVNLPSATFVALKIREEAGRHLSELSLENAPCAFTWEKQLFHPGITTLGLKIASNGQMQFGIRRKLKESAQRAHEPENWLPLTNNLVECYWEIYDPRAKRWLRSWDNLFTAPSLIRFFCKWQEDDVPIEATFAFPWATVEGAR